MCFLVCVILRFTSGVRPVDWIEVSMAAKPFLSMYLQMCLQALIKVWARARTHDHPCGEMFNYFTTHKLFHAVYYVVVTVLLIFLTFKIFQLKILKCTDSLILPPTASYGNS